MPTNPSPSVPGAALAPRRKLTMPIVRGARARVRLACGILLGATASGCVGGLSPQAELDAAQSMLELSDALVAIREEQAIMQEELDSLHRLVARQDTLIRRVADVSGVPVPR